MMKNDILDRTTKITPAMYYEWDLAFQAGKMTQQQWFDFCAQYWIQILGEYDEELDQIRTRQCCAVNV